MRTTNHETDARTRASGVCRPAYAARIGRSAQRGFSFIEILIVMGIIGVLVGGVVVAIQIWNRKGPEFATRNRVNQVATLAATWKQKFNFYPPGDIKMLPKAMGRRSVKIKGGTNSTNRGIEAFYQAIKAPGFSANHDWESGAIGNTDDDKLDKHFTKDGDPELYEILDAWGNPLVYFSNDEYADHGDEGRMIALGQDAEAGSPGDELSARPWRDENGRYLNAETFQVYSMGPDGEPNTDDDIGNWTSD